MVGKGRPGGFTCEEICGEAGSCCPFSQVFLAFLLSGMFG